MTISLFTDGQPLAKAVALAAGAGGGAGRATCDDVPDDSTLPLRSTFPT
jgi:hypothetical protein